MFSISAAMSEKKKTQALQLHFHFIHNHSVAAVSGINIIEKLLKCFLFHIMKWWCAILLHVDGGLYLRFENCTLVLFL